MSLNQRKCPQSHHIRATKQLLTILCFCFGFFVCFRLHNVIRFCFFFPFRPILNFPGLPREIKGFPHFPLLVLRKTSLIDSFAHQLVVTKLMFVIWSVKVINTLTQVNWPVSISSLTFSYIVDHILLGCLHLIRPMNFIMKTDKKNETIKLESQRQSSSFAFVR